MATEVVKAETLAVKSREININFLTSQINTDRTPVFALHFLFWIGYSMCIRTSHHEDQCADPDIVIVRRNVFLHSGHFIGQVKGKGGSAKGQRDRHHGRPDEVIRVERRGIDFFRLAVRKKFAGELNLPKGYVHILESFIEGHRITTIQRLGDRHAGTKADSWLWPCLYRS
jgi:hypothetical protein